MRTWTLQLPFTGPLSMNDREHWRPKAKRVAHVRAVTALLATQARIPRLDRIAVELHYAPPDRRRRDPLNLVATLKPIEDGLVDARIVPDDTPQYVEPTMPVLDPPAGRPGSLHVVVRELPALEPLIVGSNGHPEHLEVWP